MRNALLNKICQKRTQRIIQSILVDSDMKYHVECHFVSEGKSFIRWLLS